MKLKTLIAGAMAALVLWGCAGTPAPTTEGTGQTTQPTAPAPLTGWQEAGGVRYYYAQPDIPATGWQKIDGQRYYFAEDGAMLTGWQEIGGQIYYLSPEGPLGQGWLEEEGVRRYLTDGQAATGWLELGEERYYLDEDGVPCTGLLELEGDTYYFRADGTMARGKVELEDGRVRYFTSTGKEVLLVNPWNFIPEDYSVDLAYHHNLAGSWPVAQACLEDLEKMIADCQAAGLDPVVGSAYRSHRYQQMLFKNRVDRFIAQGLSPEEADIQARKRVAYPGTSEHELGLAVDIVDNGYWGLDEHQATMPAQIWLMENSWRYGFILRYPSDCSDHTGIIYEPWHYRYVGKELAAELRSSGLCLEEYLEQLTEE